MNTSKLRLQGFLPAVASINNALGRQGLLSNDDRVLALRKTEAEDMSPAERGAICFPIRLLPNCE